MKARIVRPSGFDSGPVFSGLPLGANPGNLEQRAERGVETGDSQEQSAAGAL